MKIKTKLKMIVLIPVVLSLVIVAVLFWMKHEINGSREMDRRADEIVKNVFELNQAMDQYLLHPEERPKIQFRLIYESVGKSLAMIQTKSEMERGTIKRIRRNHEAIGTFFRLLVSIPEDRTFGKEDVSSTELQERTIGQLLGRSREIVSDTFQLAKASEDRVDAMQERLIFFILTITLISGMAMAILSYFIGNSILKPISKLQEGTAAISSGNLKYQIGIERNDEIGQLSKAFNEMTKKLGESYVSFKDLQEEIAERKRIENALRESKQLLEKTFASLKEAVFIIDAKTVQIIDCNLSASEIFGYSQEEMLGQATAFLHVDETKLEQFRGRLYAAVKEKGGLELPEFTMKRKNGEVFITEHSVMPLKDDQGRLVAWVSVVRDITDRKRAEEALGRSENDYRTLSENLPGIVYRVFIRENNRMQFFNNFLQPMTGYTAEELSTGEVCSIEPLILSEDRATVVTKVKRAILDNQLFEVEYRLRDKGGDIRYFLERGRPIYGANGEPLYIDGVIFDITDRKQAEEDLKASEKRYRDLYEGSADGFARVDMDRNIIEFNQAFKNMLGYSDEELTKLADMDLTPEKWHPMEAKIVEEQVLTRGYSGVYEKEYRKKDGTIFPISLRTYLIKPANGRPSGMWAFVRDITVRKQMEEELRKSRDDLEIRVQERTHNLNERIKEINCLYSISYYVEKQYFLLEEKLQNIVNQLPSGWQYPEITCARIVIGGKEYKTDNFRETAWKQASNIIIHDVRVGTVEVCYLEEKPISDEGAFIKEERDLINAVAIELGEMIGHMQSDKALKEQSRILEGFFTSTITPLVFLDKDFNFVRVNGAYAKACQREISEFPGHKHFEFYPSDAKEIFEQVVETNVPYQAIARPFTFPDHPEWGITYWDWTLTPLLDDNGEVEFLVFSLEDVTERKRAEDALKTASLYTRSLIESALDPLVTISAYGKVMDVNKATELVTGVSREQLIGSDFSDYFTEPEKAREGYQEVFSKGSVRDYPLAIQHKSGTVTDVLYNATVYKKEAGEVQGVFAAARDITERKRMEEALRESESRLRTLSSELLIAQEKERKRIAGELHDSIAATLTAIKFTIENILGRMKKGTSAHESLNALILKVQQAVEETRRIMSDLRPSVLDDLGIIPATNWFCREFQKTYSRIYIEKEIDIEESDVSDSLKTVIFRISQEALNNIAKHSKANLVNLSLRKAGGTIGLVIRDNGQGFDQRETISADGSRKGLGLVSLKERAELSGGSFTIESILGEGTTICVSWPI